MCENSAQKLDDIAYALSQILKHARALSGDVAGITQEFFDLQFSISEISEIHELPKDKVKAVIRDFLIELLTKKHGMQQFLSISCVESKDAIVDPRKEANLLIETCEIPESTAAKIREVIGTAIQIAIPPIPPKHCAEVIAKLNMVHEMPMNQGAKFPIKLVEKDFFLGRLKIPAGDGPVSMAKTSSEGSVLIERGPEKVQVGFRIALEKKPAEGFAITFRGLPTWAEPVSFSFVTPERKGALKEYRLPLCIRGGKFYVNVQNQEEEMAFLDRKQAYIEFVVN